MICLTLPIKLVTESNAKGHWRPKAARAKLQRHATYWATRARVFQVPSGRWKALPGWTIVNGPFVITVTRIAPRALDVDNAWSSAKHVIDGVADALGINDRDPRVTWRVEQRKGAPREYAVEIRIEASPETAREPQPSTEESQKQKRDCTHITKRM